MSRSLLLVAALLAVGCARNDPAPPLAGTAPAEAAPAQVATADCPPPRYSPLPPGVSLDQDFLVRRDRVAQTKSGAMRRRTSLEILGGSPVALANGVVDGLVRDGYRKLDVADRGDGVTRFAVVKRGAGRINVSATSDRGSNPSHPRSVGVIAFDWPVPADAPAATAAPGTAG